MECLAVSYLRENWDGWPLHCLIAVILMHPIITNSYPKLMFTMHVIFWPMREAWQHGGLDNIWTAHRLTEALAPVLAAGIMLCILERYPYHRKK